MRWTSGPVTTFFIVEPGSTTTPDLGVLRVTSLVAIVGDRDLALLQCHALNMVAMTHRWTIAPTGLDPDTETLQVSCSFVVGQHTVAALEEFALWCVREQIAIAAAKLTNYIADDIGGRPVRIPGHEAGDYREVADGDVLGTWVRGSDGLAYEVVIPPIPVVWPGWFMVQETLSWIGRHVIERVQAAVAL